MKIDKIKLSCEMFKAGITSGKQLAEVAGVSVNTISRINNGNAATINTIGRLAKALGVDPTELIETREA